MSKDGSSNNYESILFIVAVILGIILGCAVNHKKDHHAVMYGQGARGKGLLRSTLFEE